MLPRADSVSPVGRAEPAARAEGVAHARQEQFQRSLSMQVGQSVLGEILARHTDGSYLVRLGAAAARMQLPAGAQLGAQIPMTLVALAPRPTFSLAAADALPDAAPLLVFADGADDAHALERMGKAALSGAAAAGADDGAPAPAGNAHLSEAAKTLSSVLGAALKHPDTSGAVRAAAPLAPAPGAAPAQLALALREALASSGLFYESHLAEWAEGKRALADLLREPQMLRAAQDGPGARAALTDPATAQLINLQLGTQEHARLAWQGQLWPGQALQWDVAREQTEHGRGAEPEAAADWHSRLRLRFPLLGEIDARLVLRGEVLELQLRTGADGAAAELLRRHAGALDGALAAAGIALSSLEIGAGGARDGPDG
ncbi:MAG: flagellar hook-length control protein FliK [Pseudomonadota bacterium]